MTDGCDESEISAAERQGAAKLFARLVVAAGALAMETLARPRIAARLKSDQSPVSEADERIEAYLLAELSRALPGVPVIAEEAAARGETPPCADAFLLIDPIDGTREFIARSTEFSVNVALVTRGTPVAGAIFAPAQGRVWFAGTQSFAAAAAPGAALAPEQEWRPLKTRRPPPDGLTALVSKSHLVEATERFLSRLPLGARLPMGSSIKFCRIAEGEADVYPRFGRTMEWDTAAVDAILRAAGGATLDPDGAALRYGKAEAHYRNGPFVAWGDPTAATLY
jgi:3'(2'), 5'-bisphosphate nucleotidase